MQPGIPLKLSELNRLIGAAIEGHFRDQLYFILAETSDISNYPEKRQCYFTLVEKDPHFTTIVASMRASIWGNCYATIRQFEEQTGEQFKDNMQLLLKVKVQYHPHYGLSAMVYEIDARYTLGKLALNRQAVLERLVNNNPGFIRLVNGEYLTRNKELAFPPVIQKLALVTSASADGYHDFRKELFDNAFQYRFEVDEYLAQVQGNDAHQQMLDQLLAIHASGKAYDAVVLVRGGGGQLDFSAFDQYQLARVVARFPIPIITGIGHERNESIVDVMACCKTKTPTKAAATIVAHNRKFEEKVLNLQKTIVLLVKETMAEQTLAVQGVKNQVVRKTNELLNRQQGILQPLGGKLVRQTRQKLENSRLHLFKASFAVKCAAEHQLKDEQCLLTELAQTVKYLNPEAILKRGYALVYANGKIITDASNLQPGDTIETQMAGGKVSSQVTAIIKTHETATLNL